MSLRRTGESRANIQKITRLTKLEPKLQEMVDKKVLPVHTASEISYLKPQEQKKLTDAIVKEGGTVPSGSQAAALKKESQAGNLTPECPRRQGKKFPLSRLFPLPEIPLTFHGKSLPFSGSIEYNFIM